MHWWIVGKQYLLNDLKADFRLNWFLNELWSKILQYMYFCELSILKYGPIILQFWNQIMKGFDVYLLADLWLPGKNSDKHVNFKLILKLRVNFSPAVYGCDEMYLTERSSDISVCAAREPSSPYASPALWSRTESIGTNARRTDSRIRCARSLRT